MDENEVYCHWNCVEYEQFSEIAWYSDEKEEEMNLIEKWKSRETKRKLREENIRLKAEMDVYMRSPSLNRTKIMNVQRICAEWMPTGMERDVPSEIVKHELLHKLTEQLSDFVQYDFIDGRSGHRMYIATLYVATEDKRNESSN